MKKVGKGKITSLVDPKEIKRISKLKMIKVKKASILEEEKM